MTNTTEQHPDIEIYIKSPGVEPVETWLKQRFGTLTRTRQGKLSHHYTTTHEGQQIAILVQEKAAGAFTSLWFDSAATPWSQDIECAREALAFFNQEIRCIASGWQEGDDPDEWWSVGPEGEKLITWHT